MIALSYKFSLKKVSALLLVTLLGLTTGGLVMNLVTGNSKPIISVNQSSELELPKVEDNQQRLAVITALGWQVEEEPIQIKEIIIPQEPDQQWLDYMALQTSQGLDLEDYLGERVKKYSYNLENYPDTSLVVWLNLYVYKDKIIAGDISPLSSELPMEGLQGNVV